MAKLTFGAIFWLLLLACSNAASPLFVSAITSALATIPFSGGPMTTGLVGAKLGIGTKLLYYLGYFGRKSPSKPKKKAASGSNLSSQTFKQQSPAVQRNPLATFGGVDPSQLFQVLTAQGVDPSVVMEAINYAGNNQASNAAFGGFGANGPSGSPGFSSLPGGSGFPAGYGFSSMPAGSGFPAGFSQSMTGGSGFPTAFSPSMPGGAGFSPSMPGGSGFPAGFSPSMPGGAGFTSSMPGGSGFPTGFTPSMPGGSGFPAPAQGSSAEDSLNQPNIPESESEDDAESFFNFLTDMDENTCISRLICDIGYSPSFLGEFSENISNMVSTLKVSPTSRAFKYIEIMENGKKEGECSTKFPECGDVSYEVVKNVAPSVSLPQNVDINF